MYRIGILQLTQNLDDAVQGFKHGLTKYGIQPEYHYLNADGNLNELPKMADKLAKLDVDLIFACTTPAAKAATALPGSIPTIFTPVFDPVGAGLVNSMEKPGGKTTGVAGMVPATAKVDFIRRLLPDAKKLGVLYHCQDTNALLELNTFKSAAEDFFSITELSIKQPEDLSHLANKLDDKLDAIFLPIGRALEDNFASIVYYTDAIGLPVIASHAPNVSAGALAGLVANHFRLGESSAEKARQILEGTDPGNIPVGFVERPEILLNAFTAQNLGIEFPADLVAEAKEIYE